MSKVTKRRPTRASQGRNGGRKAATTVRPQSAARAAAGGGITSMRDLAAHAGQHARPEFLVVFKKPSEQNAQAISQVLGVRPAMGVASTAQRMVFEAARAGGARTRMYERLAVAATDLSPAQHAKLEKAPNVLAVVRNEIRRLPPTMEGGEPRGPRGDGSGGFSNGDAGSDALAYLRGHRDGLDMAMALLRGAPAGRPLATIELGARAGASAGSSTQAASISWCLTMIGIQPGSLTGNGATVAVLDTGIDLHHPDFVNRIDPTQVESFVPGVTSVQDGNGHGTHCAGVVAGPLHPAGGRRYGVAPDATLLVGKVLTDAGSGYDDGILDGIAWAAETGANVISMSLGSVRSAGGDYPLPYEQVASNLLAQGVVIVAASGNESSRPSNIAPVGNPAACPSIAAVAAVDRAGAVAWFSSGRVDDIGAVECAAPGVAVYSAYMGGGYKLLNGTSMATPHVAGVLALLIEAKPALRGRALLRTLLKGCAKLAAPATDVGAGLARAPAPSVSKRAKPQVPFADAPRPDQPGSWDF